MQLLDWQDTCQRCEDVSVAAAFCLLGVGRETLRRLAAEVGLPGLQQHLYKGVGKALIEGERFQQVWGVTWVRCAGWGWCTTAAAPQRGAWEGQREGERLAVSRAVGGVGKCLLGL